MSFYVPDMIMNLFQQDNMGTTHIQNNLKLLPSCTFGEHFSKNHQENVSLSESNVMSQVRYDF